MRNLNNRLDKLEKDIQALSSTQNGEVWVVRTKKDGTLDERLEYKFPSERPLRINIQSFGEFDPINRPIN